MGKYVKEINDTQFMPGDYLQMTVYSNILFQCMTFASLPPQKDRTQWSVTSKTKIQESGKNK